jgi:uncharacterized protein (TIGR02594 family)
MITMKDQGVQVRIIQLLLNSFLKPSPNLKVDGHFGPATQKAVKTYQSLHGLAPDGNVDPMTLIALGLKEHLWPIPTMISPNAPWMDLAIAELGVHEYSLPGRHNPRIIEYHQTTVLKATDDETPWCSSFVNWVMLNSGRKGTNNAAARSWLEWGCAVSNPYPGVITVIKKKTASYSQATGSSSGFHVGFFNSLSPSHLRLLGGNQNNRVKYSDFPLSGYEIKGYRRPSL